MFETINVGIIIFGIIPIFIIIFFIGLLILSFMFIFLFNINYDIMENKLIKGIIDEDLYEPFIIAILSMLLMIPYFNIFLSLIIWKLFIILILRINIMINEINEINRINKL